MGAPLQNDRRTSDSDEPIRLILTVASPARPSEVESPTLVMTGVLAYVALAIQIVDIVNRYMMKLTDLLIKPSGLEILILPAMIVALCLWRAQTGLRQLRRRFTKTK